MACASRRYAVLKQTHQTPFQQSVHVSLQVRMSPDMLIAYILWSANPECQDAAEREIDSRWVLPGLKTSTRSKTDSMLGSLCLHWQRLYAHQCSVP